MTRSAPFRIGLGVLLATVCAVACDGRSDTDSVVVASTTSLYDTGLLDKMCSVLVDAVAVGSRLAPAAQDVAVEAASGDRPKVEALLAAQDANLAALDRLLTGMRGWQSLSDMTIELRRIIDEQETLIREMDEDADEDER